MQKLSISEIAERYLERWLDGLQAGEIELWQLPSAVAAFYHAGFGDGISQNPQTERVKQLEHENDRLYIAAFTPKQRKQFLLERYEKSFEFDSPSFESTLLNIIRKQSLEDATRAEDGATANGSRPTVQPSVRNPQTIHHPADAA